jgi:hypothetical protein
MIRESFLLYIKAQEKEKMFQKALFNISKSPHFLPENHIVRRKKGSPGLFF